MSGNFIAEWNTFTAAAHSLGLKDGSEISKCAHHKKHRNSAYGYKWELQHETNYSISALAELSQTAFSLASKETINALQNIINNNT